MNKRFVISWLGFSLTFAIVLAILQASKALQVDKYSYAALGFLTLLNLVSYLFIKGKDGGMSKAVIRRVMIASMLRLFLAAIFLVISLKSMGFVNFHFVGIYCVLYLLFMLFDIYNLRSNLRPVSNPASEN